MSATQPPAKVSISHTRCELKQKSWNEHLTPEHCWPCGRKTEATSHPPSRNSCKGIRSEVRTAGKQQSHQTQASSVIVHTYTDRSQPTMAALCTPAAGTCSTSFSCNDATKYLIIISDQSYRQFINHTMHVGSLCFLIPGRISSALVNHPLRKSCHRLCIHHTHNLKSHEAQAQVPPISISPSVVDPPLQRFVACMNNPRVLETPSTNPKTPTCTHVAGGQHSTARSRHQKA